MSFHIQEEGSGNDKKLILKNEQTGTSAEIFCFGALLNAFTVQSGKDSINVVDGFTDVSHAKADMNNGFKSAKLSPFVCRMHKGTYRFNEVDYTVDGFYLNGHAIHGLLCHANFSVTDKGADTDKAWVTLEHSYNATDKGYPFAYTLSVTWSLYANNRLTVSTIATNRHNSSLPFSDGWHPYFATDTSIDESSLSFNTDRKLIFDKDLLPTGAEERDDRFIKGTVLKGIELDNCFALPANEKGICVLQGQKISIRIEPDKAYPYLQVYTPPHRKSIAIENLSAAPDSFNNKIGIRYLEPSETAVFTTSYQVVLL